jgi:DNA-binding Lrp family transcriptional regulator
MILDDTDRLLLNHLQDGFPIAAHPYKVVADQLGLTEQIVLDRLKALKENRMITRFGPFFDAAALGGAFCLCAMAVPEDEFETVLTKVNAYAEVAHNYERSHRLNMWFVLATETQEEIAQVATSLRQETGHNVLCFPKLREFFIRFRVAA